LALAHIALSDFRWAVRLVPEKRESTPHLITEGSRIVIPEGSPLRSKLTIEAVGEKEIQRTLMLPANVEADPGRLVKVLPPLAGRITQLKVQLGERVDVGQPLVVLDSPDLATAQAEHERAIALVALAQKAHRSATSQNRRGAQGSAAGGSRLPHRRSGAPALRCSNGSRRQPGYTDNSHGDHRRDRRKRDRPCGGTRRVLERPDGC
jgi:cobalt-zinc-cadmium efflux system membrane fusion protein